MATLNATQRKALNYLADPARSESQRVLNGFNGRGLFGSVSDAKAIEIITEYFRTNPDNWCKEGINRAEKYFGINVTKKTYKLGDKVTLSDIQNGLNPGTNLQGDSKHYFVIPGGTTICAEDNRTGKEKNHFGPDKTWTIVYLPD